MIICLILIFLINFYCTRAQYSTNKVIEIELTSYFMAHDPFDDSRSWFDLMLLVIRHLNLKNAICDQS